MAFVMMKNRPFLKRALGNLRLSEKKHDVKSMLKDLGANYWVYPIEKFSATPEGYFIKQSITFANKGDVANLREFNCSALWFFGFDSGHPGYEWANASKVELHAKIHRLCSELAFELDRIKWAVLFPQDYKL